MVRQQVPLQQKLLISLFCSILFIILSMPIVYHFTNGIFETLDIHVLGIDGNPTITGLVLHAIVFGLIVLLTMYF
jgi:hypothetical protein|uniref:Uncharacterized protein n=1 Tax=viral metagenome TaxID=1070528 RepID=A0A6C0KPS4_9ZZZZ